MKKWLSNLYNYMQWVIIVLLLISYFAYLVVDFEDGSITLVFSDWRIYAHLAFVVTMQLIIVDAGTDMSVKNAVTNDVFKEANTSHQKLVKSYFNNFDKFKLYVDDINTKNQRMTQEMFLKDKGTNDVNDLNKKDLKDYNKLTYDRIDLRGYTKPLIQQGKKKKNGVTSTDVSTDLNGKKRRKQATKIIFAIVLGVLSHDVKLNLGNAGSAFFSTLIIGTQLLVTLLVTYAPNYYRLTELVPELVKEKLNTYNAFLDVKDTIELPKEVEEEIETDDTLVKHEVIVL